MSQYCVTSVNDFQKAVKTTVTQRQPAANVYDSAEKSYTNNRHEKRRDWYDLALKKKIQKKINKKHRNIRTKSQKLPVNWSPRTSTHLPTVYKYKKSCRISQNCHPEEKLDTLAKYQ